jgi:hypothetical protein
MHRIVEFARVELGVTLFPGQAAALDAYYSSGKPSWLLLAGRRSGKSLLSDIIACFEAVVPDFTGILRPDEERFIIVVSVRQDSANLHVKAIAKLLRHTHALGQLIINETKDRLELSNGATILSLPASARAGRGYTASALILDELAHFQDSEGNPGSDQVFEAFLPTLATFGDAGRCVITTTPMSRTGIVFDIYDRSLRGELDDTYLTKAATREMNPKVSDRVINRAMARDAESARTEYYAEFRDPIEAYLSTERIEASVDRNLHRQDKGQAGVIYYMAIDPATMGDRYAFLIAHKEDTKVVLDYSHIIKPPVNPEAAEDLLLDLVRRFKPVSIRCDTAATVQRLRDKIPALEYTPFTRPKKLAWYGALKEALNLGNLVLYRDDDLLDELKALQIRNGVDIAAPKAGKVTHDDLSDCLALVCENLVAGYGELHLTSNPFYGPDSDSYYRLQFKPHHSPGATGWRDCKYRVRGCQQCVDEMEQEGIFAKQAADVAGITPLSEAEYYKQFENNTGIGYLSKLNQQEAAHEQEFLRKFGKAARDQLGRGD